MVKNKLTLQDYIELRTTEYRGLIQKMVHQLSVVSGKPPHEIYEYEEDELLSSFESIRWINQPINTSDSREVLKVNEYEFKLIDLSDITLGQFIDLESFISGTNYLENLGEIVSCLYLRYEDSPIDKIQFEDYGKVDIEKRSNIFLSNVYIDEVWGTIQNYLRFRSNFFDSYDLFDSSDDDDIDVESLTEEQLEIYNEEKEKQEQDREWMWESILAMMADDDITKYESILGMNLFFVFNQLTYLRNKSRRESNKGA